MKLHLNEWYVDKVLFVIQSYCFVKISHESNFYNWAKNKFNLPKYVQQLAAHVALTVEHWQCKWKVLGFSVGSGSF